MNVDFSEIMRDGLAFARENEPISLILSIIGITVALFMFRGLLEDIEKAIMEWLFWRWLKKDGRFMNFETEGEARAGYQHYLDARKYRSMTRSWRKKYESKNGLPSAEAPKKGFGERISRMKTSVLNFWEALDYITIPDMDDIRNFFANRLSGKRKSEQNSKPAHTVSLEKNKSDK